MEIRYQLRELLNYHLRHGQELMRYILKMLVAFIVGMYAVVSASRNAADGNWTAVFVLGVLVFALFVFMAYSSVAAEREAGKQ